MWSYTKMLGLSGDLVEHRLPIKQGFWLFKQLARNFSPKVDQLLQAGFICPCCYAEWVLNVVPAEKKNLGKLWVYVDFRNLNPATPKDEYPMSVADILIISTSGNKVISFFDHNTGDNQIFMAEGDITKIVF
jgi:hypothetical protein